LFENQIQTTSASPCRTQVQPAASFLVCSLVFIEYKDSSYQDETEEIYKKFKGCEPFFL
ncbi:DNA or RNA helicases of superfamily II, partial [Streptococcus sp. GMD1S]